MLFLRSLLFSIGMIVSIVIVVAVGLFTRPLPFRYRYHTIRMWAVFNLWSLKKLCGIDSEVEGVDNIPKETSIVFCKHQSTWETMILQQIFPPQVYVIKRELLWIPVFGWGLAMLNPIAINRQLGATAKNQIIIQGTQRLDNGLWVIIFPEGTRISPGKKVRYKMGGAILAEANGYPIVPVAHNAGDFWPKRGFLKHPGTIKVVIGPMIQTKGRSAKDILRNAEHWIESTMQRISITPYDNP